MLELYFQARVDGCVWENRELIMARVDFSWSARKFSFESSVLVFRPTYTHSALFQFDYPIEFDVKFRESACVNTTLLRRDSGEIQQ